MQIIKVFTRIFARNLADILPFYEGLVKEKADLYVNYKELNLELASVGDFLLIAGSDAALEPFRTTVATILVDSLADFRSFLERSGAAVISGPQAVPTGWNMRVRHPDGSVIEYVEPTGR